MPSPASWTGSGGGPVTQATSPWVVGDGGGSLTVDGPLTDAQLRAAAVIVDVQEALALDASVLAVRDRLPAALVGDRLSIDVGAAVALGLDAATLTALETVQLGSAVALDAATLAALETVGLDAATLAALETISVANFPAVQPVNDNGGSLTVDGPLTDAQLRAAVVPVGDGGGSLTVDGPLTDAQLRAAAVPVTDVELVAMTWISAALTAQAANAVILDTGQLVAGDYDFDLWLGSAGVVAAGKCILVEHRNAANNATLQTLAAVGSNESLYGEVRRFTIATNERVRAIIGAVAFAAAERSQAAIGRRAA